MSQFGGFGGSGLVIHHDNAENAMNPALRKTKREDLHGKPPANKRAALGVITNTTRVQPSRAAKQGLGSEGFCGSENVPTKAKVFTSQENNVQSAFAIPQAALASQTFSIHVDSDIKPTSIGSLPHVHNDISGVQEPRLHPSVTSLRQPLSTVCEAPTDILISSPEPQESPMLLDTSIESRHVEEDNAETRLKRVLTVPEYASDIYRYLREAELKNRPKSCYMRKQPDITNSMRSILVDWLVEVSEEYKLHRETLCLSVNYIDRFLSQMSVLRGKLQLVGAASMFLAAKYEEIYPPEVGEFVYITDDTYSKKQVLRMEHLILKVLSFDVAVPTVNCFCEKFLEHQGADERTGSLAMYLCELSMVDAEVFLKHLPSVIAASALCLANQTLGLPAWSNQMIDNTGYTLADLSECLHDLYQAFCKAPQHPQQAIQEKYKQSKYHQVSLLAPPHMLQTAMQ